MDLAPVSIPATDGWTRDIDTWAYVSATSFKVKGKDVTARFPVGTKLKLIQTTAKYFYVVSAAFSTDTTVTITGGSVYSLDNAEIDSPCYSYASSPQGFPGFFKYTIVNTGFSKSPSWSDAYFTIQGRNVTVFVVMADDGVSNSTSFTTSLPVPVTSDAGFYAFCPITIKNNSIWQTNFGLARLSKSDTVATINVSVSTPNFTASGTKAWDGTLHYLM